MLDTNDIQVLRDMFAESETRTRNWTEALLQKELHSMRDDIIEVINDGVLPKINSLAARVTRLERMQRQAAY